MHDPAEMIRRIEELEKGLPPGNRPETLYARAALLQAETIAKMLFVFIDFSQKADRLIDIMAERTASADEFANQLFANRQWDSVNMVKDKFPESIPMNGLICRLCKKLVQRRPMIEGPGHFECGCIVYIEGEPLPSQWEEVRADLQPDTDLVDAEFDKNVHQADGRQRVSAPDDDKNTETPETDFDEGGLGEFDEAGKSSTGSDAETEGGDLR